MPTPAYSGRKPLYLLRPRFTSIILAAMGTALSGAGIPKEVAQFFLREAGSLTFKRAGDTSVNKTLLPHVYQADLKLPSLQTTYRECLNAFLLSTTLVQAGITTNANAGAAFVANFVNNTGGQDAVGGTVPAAGSSYLGIIPTLTIDDMSAKLEIEGKCELWDGEYEWLVDPANTAAIGLGDAGGTALGIVTQTYGRANNLRGGLVDCTIAGQPIGIRKKGFKFSMKGVDTSGGDHKARPICTEAEVTIEIIKRQMMADMLVDRYFAQNDGAMVLTLADGNTITIDAGVLGLADEATIDEKDPNTKLTLKGNIVYPNSWTATPDSIDMGVTLATDLHLKRIGY